MVSISELLTGGTPIVVVVVRGPVAGVLCVLCFTPQLIHIRINDDLCKNLY